VVGTAVTHAGDEETLLSQLKALRQLHPSFVYVFSSGEHAVQILKAHHASGLHGQLVASAFTVEDYLLPRLGAAAVGVRSCASWPTAVVDKEFAAAFRKKSGRHPDAFAVLGYETGLLVAAGARRAAR